MSEKVNVVGDRPVNTRRLQMFELSHFMLAEQGAIFDGVGFTNIEFGSQYSFNQAVDLFNNREEKGDDGYILDRVKLRYSKKSKAITCTNHWIKPVQEFQEQCADDGAEVFAAVKQVMQRLRLR